MACGSSVTSKHCNNHLKELTSYGCIRYLNRTILRTCTKSNSKIFNREKLLQSRRGNMRYRCNDNEDWTFLEESFKVWILSHRAVLLRLSDAIDRFTPEQFGNAAKQSEVSNRFEAQFSPIPPFDLDRVRLPVLGRWTELDEKTMERYCRVNVLIRSLQNALAPSKWNHTFKCDKHGPYDSKVIARTSIPMWMRAVDFAPVDPLVVAHNQSYMHRL